MLRGRKTSSGSLGHPVLPADHVSFCRYWSGTMEAGSAPQDGNKGQDQSASEGDFRKITPPFVAGVPLRTVRLNYFNANWSKVLRKVADATGSELVMHKAPPGHITRYDRNRYSRTDAVRILKPRVGTGRLFGCSKQGKFSYPAPS